MSAWHVNKTRAIINIRSRYWLLGSALLRRRQERLQVFQLSRLGCSIALYCTAGVLLVLHCFGGRSPMHQRPKHQNTALCHGATPGMVRRPFVVCFKKAKLFFLSFQNLHTSLLNCWLLFQALLIYFELNLSQQSRQSQKSVFLLRFCKMQHSIQSRALQSVQFWPLQCSSWFWQCNKIQWNVECNVRWSWCRTLPPSLCCLGGWGRHWTGGNTTVHFGTTGSNTGGIKNLFSI